MLRGLRILIPAALAVPLLLVPAVPAVASARHPHQHPYPSRSVQVVGAVDAPATLSRADLAALPQTTLTDARPQAGGHQLTGVLLQTVVDDAAPQLPSAKNAALRVSITVSGRHHRAVTTAWGELDPGFGNHPALLVLSRDGRAVRSAPELVFPSDTNRARTVRDVARIAVAVAPTGATDVDEGSVAVRTGARSTTVSLAQLAALPQQTRTVSFLASGAPQSHTETGPTLAAVLRLARSADRHASTTGSIAATGSDGYVAVVTSGEATSGGRPLLLSLVEDGQTLTRPRLVPDGDVRGGRYVSDVTSLDVSRPGCR